MRSPNILPEIKQSLEAFLASTSRFRVVRSVPRAASSLPQPPRTLFILDASFNPPSIAHLTLATSALRDALKGSAERYRPPYRLLLLFSSHNADKSPGPAPFEHRLAFMYLFALDLVEKMKKYGSAEIDVDVGLTNEPYYGDKSVAVEESGIYQGTSHDSSESMPQHVHLVGYDTFTRIFDAKYYSDHKPPLSALASFFDKHALRITLRPEEKWGSVEEQRQFWDRIGNGEFEGQGGKKEWAQHIEMVDSEDEGVGVSSTRIREAVQKEDWHVVEQLCTPRVSDWLREHDVYDKIGASSRKL